MHWNARHNAPEVSILSLGRLTISSPGENSTNKRVYQVDQDILHARVNTTSKVANTTVHLRSWTSDKENTFHRDRLRTKGQLHSHPNRLGDAPY